jgi:predicted O-linked N-acetylglucosamine transferase (SPINDLY family)
VISAGVPLLTMQGNTMVSKMGSSILNSSQLVNTIADSYENYKTTCLNIKLRPISSAKLKSSDNSAVANALLNKIYVE